MSKLFAGGEISGLKFSTEEFKNYYGNASVVSLEALSDYFYKIKDSFNTISSSVANLNNDKIVTDIFATRFETQHVLKRVKFNELRVETVSKPEKFKGKYVDYTAELIAAANILVPNTEETLNTLKLAISSFINEYQEDKISNLYGVAYFKEAEKLTETHRKDISKYFSSNNSVKAEIGDLLKSLSDVEQLFNDVQKLDEIINLNHIEHLIKLSKEAAELVDLLIEQNSKSGILLKNDSTKKELVKAIHISATEIETVSYLYSNCVFLYGAIKSLSEKIIEVGNRS